MLTLSTAYWCILVAAILPYVWVAIAKSGGKRYDNRDPRTWVARQDDPKVQRAHAAHLNSFEAFAPFAAGVLLAQAAGVPVDRIALLAIGFVMARVAHGLCYLANLATLRSAMWFAGLLCAMSLIAMAALRTG